jgi:hypothetical protein
VKPIAALIDNGAEPLFRTPHQVLAAPSESGFQVYMVAD